MIEKITWCQVRVHQWNWNDIEIGASIQTRVASQWRRTSKDVPNNHIVYCMPNTQNAHTQGICITTSFSSIC